MNKQRSTKTCIIVISTSQQLTMVNNVINKKAIQYFGRSLVLSEKTLDWNADLHPVEGLYNQHQHDLKDSMLYIL